MSEESKPKEEVVSAAGAKMMLDAMNLTAEKHPNWVQVETACKRVAEALGPALLELTYERALVIELGMIGFRTQEQFRMRGTYKGRSMDTGQDIDILVDNTLVIELKAVETVTPAYYAQLHTYMRFAHKEYGLLVNFDVPTVNDLVFNWVHVDPEEFMF